MEFLERERERERYHNQFRATCADIKEVKTRIRKVWRNRKRNQFLLLHDNVREHTILRTREATATMEWTVFSHPPYSPDLTPFDFQLFRTLKDANRGRPFADDELKYNMREELRRFKKSFTHTASQSVLVMKETLWKNDLKFCEDCTHHKSKFNYKFNHTVQKKDLFSYSLL